MLLISFRIFTVNTMALFWFKDRKVCCIMTMQETIDRINELYHKSQNEGLTEEEKTEQKELRQQYVLSIRRSLRGQLDNIDIQEADGSITNLGEKYGNKELH